MIQSPNFLFTILAFLAVLGPLVFIHELGHYLAGRWFGVKSEAFSIGFGREVAGWTDRRGTRWKIGWLPLGGYVKFKGDMNPASQPSPEWLAMPPAERAQTFQAKKLWQRAVIVAAGPATNFLFAILVYIVLFASLGQPSTPALIAGIQPNSAAAAAGFQPGDRVVRIDGDEVRRFEDIASHVRLRPEQPMRFEVERAGERIALQAVPRSMRMTDRFGNEARIGLLGISPGGRTLEQLAWYELPGAAVRQTWDTVKMMVVTLGQVFSGQRSLEEMGGPLKIAQFSGQQASLGFVDFVLFMSLISINLGFINLLPIPLLDGGHLLFYAIEGIRRRPLKAQAQEWAFRTGLAVLLALMVFVTFNDLASFGLFNGLRGLIG